MPLIITAQAQVVHVIFQGRKNYTLIWKPRLRIYIKKKPRLFFHRVMWQTKARLVRLLNCWMRQLYILMRLIMRQ